MAARKHFEDALGELKRELTEMCRLTEAMIRDANDALRTLDRALGKSIGERDRQVDDLEMDIEKKCMRILLRQQPVAKDFRKVSTALKMITDIERFGDQASDIGDLVCHLPASAAPPSSASLLQMGEIALKMVRLSVDSFIRHDQPLADAVIAMDDEMDGLFLAVQSELIDRLRRDATDAEIPITLMMVAKYYERIGDHAVNVAEWTKYYESGVHLKF